jgi:hypothetical protein
MPVWLLVPAHGLPMIVGSPWKDDSDKERIRLRMRAHMKRLDVVAYSFVTEAWTATVEPDEVNWEDGTLKDPSRRARNRADREEVVIACACTATETVWKQWRIVREATTERIVDLKEKPFTQSQRPPEGWLAEMLK